MDEPFDAGDPLPGRPVDRLIHIVRSRLQFTSIERREAVLRLAAYDSGPAIAALIFALADEDPAIRLAAGRALSQIGAPAAGYLLAGLRHESAFVRKGCLDALRGLGETEAAGPFVRLARRDPDWSVRASAVEALGQFPPGFWVRRALIRALRKDPAPEVRAAAAQALASLGQANARRPLEQALRDENTAVQKAARQALEHLDSAGT